MQTCTVDCTESCAIDEEENGVDKFQCIQEKCHCKQETIENQMHEKKSKSKHHKKHHKEPRKKSKGAEEEFESSLALY